MSSSTASAGLKRGAVEDEDPQTTEETRTKKRPKTAKKPSSNGDETVSRFFTRNDAELPDALSPRDSDGETSKPEAAAPAKASVYRDRWISPPPTSRHHVPLESFQSEDSKNEPPDPSKKTANDKEDDTGLKVNEYIGDMFAAPANALLIHACNCEGHWGKGIALAFKKQYPAAYKIYEKHCKKPNKQLIGKALLIPPQTGDRHKHYVGCLFTSSSSGLRVDPPFKILRATGPAVTDLLAKARSYVSSGKGDISEMRICQSGIKSTQLHPPGRLLTSCTVNSVLFKVPWEETLEVLKTKVDPHGFKSLDVFSREED